MRLAAKIRFAKSKFRTPHALYNLPTKKKENPLIQFSELFGHISHYHELMGSV